MPIAAGWVPVVYVPAGSERLAEEEYAVRFESIALAIL